MSWRNQGRLVEDLRLGLPPGRITGKSNNLGKDRGREESVQRSLRPIWQGTGAGRVEPSYWWPWKSA